MSDTRSNLIGRSLEEARVREGLRDETPCGEHDGSGDLEAFERRTSESARTTEKALAEIATLALDRLAEIGQLRRERDELRHAEAQAALRVARLTAEVDRLRSAHQETSLRLDEISRLRDEQERQLDTIARSATWRLVRPAHRAVEAIPIAHRLLRFGRRVVGRAARLTRRGEGAPRA